MCLPVECGQSEVAQLGAVDIEGAVKCFNKTSGQISSFCNASALLDTGYFNFITSVLSDPRVKDSSAASAFLVDQFAVRDKF